MPARAVLPVLLLLSLAAACQLSPRASAEAGAGPAAASTGRLAPAPPQPTPTPFPPTSITAAPRPSSTPARLPSPTPIPEISLLFTGDINPARCVYHTSKLAGDMALPYRALADQLQTADLLIGSLDAAISDVNPPVPCAETRNLLAPSETVQGLQFAGFDVVTAATNHIKDCGLVRGCVDESMLDTLRLLRAAGIQPVGAGRDLAEALTPVIVTVQGVRFAFLGFCAIDPSLWAGADRPGTAPLQPEVYLQAIRQAREQADVVIVLPHWGTEYSARINWEQINGAQAMVEAGAQLVIGNHPHRVQGVETFPNGAVAAYALGNFVFDQAWSDGTQYTLQGLLFRAVFRGAQLQRVELLPIHIHDEVQPHLAPPEEAAQILQAVADSLAAMPGR